MRVQEEKPDARHHHAAELLPALREARRHDRHRLTEATEFMKIYDLGVVEVPTNRPMVRADKNDQVYKTRDGKWHAVVRESPSATPRPASRPRRHDLRRGLQAARRAAEEAGHPHTVLNASPSTPSARARSSRRPARWAR